MRPAPANFAAWWLGGKSSVIGMSATDGIVSLDLPARRRGHESSHDWARPGVATACGLSNVWNRSDSNPRKSIWRFDKSARPEQSRPARLRRPFTTLRHATGKPTLVHPSPPMTRPAAVRDPWLYQVQGGLMMTLRFDQAPGWRDAGSAALLWRWEVCSA
jgi:hypothetical protein